MNGQATIADVLEKLLSRARSGLLIGLAVIEHREADLITVELYDPASTSSVHLGTGAATLLQHIVDDLEAAKQELN